MTSSRLPASFSRRASLARIHRLDHLEQLRGLARLVRLQVADQVETRARETGHRGLLAFELLHVVLAELAQPELPGLANEFRRERPW